MEEKGGKHRASETRFGLNSNKDKHHPVLVSKTNHFYPRCCIESQKKKRRREKVKRIRQAERKSFTSSPPRLIHTWGQRESRRRVRLVFCLWGGVLKRKKELLSPHEQILRLYDPCQRVPAILCRGTFTLHICPPLPDAQGNPRLLRRCLALP